MCPNCKFSSCQLLYLYSNSSQRRAPWFSALLHTIPSAWNVPPTSWLNTSVSKINWDIIISKEGFSENTRKVSFHTLHLCGITKYISIVTQHCTDVLFNWLFHIRPWIVKRCVFIILVPLGLSTGTDTVFDKSVLNKTLPHIKSLIH